MGNFPVILSIVIQDQRSCQLLRFGVQDKISLEKELREKREAPNQGFITFPRFLCSDFLRDALMHILWGEYPTAFIDSQGERRSQGLRVSIPFISIMLSCSFCLIMCVLDFDKDVV